jgi:2-C-methyl-D-erythritol 2,4-cyclodiphosphate synthase
LTIYDRRGNGRGEKELMRIGSGYDIHRLVDGRKLILGGVEIDFEKGLLGHSDADVLLHAVCDALLGAAGLGDIGRHFPDTDPRYKDIDSMKLLRRTAGRVREAGYHIVNADATLFAQAPRIAPYRDRMRANIARGLEIEADRVNIKATTTEGLGPMGRGEGIGAMCVVLIENCLRDGQ